MPCFCALDLVTTVSNLRGRDAAISKAVFMIRVTPARVKMAVSVAISSGWPRWARPPWPAYSPSEFSRTITQSISPGFTARSGLVRPGSTRVGRILAYWSKPWQMRSRRPQRVMSSGTCWSPTAPKKMASKPFSVSSPSSAIILPVAR